VLTRDTYSEGVNLMNNMTKGVLHLCIFISIANLPFITVTQLVGMDVFLDSFENTEHYLYLQEDGNMRGIDIANDEYVIIKKSSHPAFHLHENDMVIYYNEKGEAACRSLSHITAAGSLLKYYLVDHSGTQPDSVIYDTQVIGKVVSTIEKSVWTAFCLQIWDITISQLNIRSFM